MIGPTFCCQLTGGKLPSQGTAALVHALGILQVKGAFLEYHFVG